MAGLVNYFIRLEITIYKINLKFMESPKKRALIIGAGPAGLTAGYELQARTDIEPIIFEMDDCFGGISRTINYKGNRMDLGGHRFFSKSDRVMEWWGNIMPLGKLEESKITEPQGNGLSTEQGQTDDEAMLVRNRSSRILYLGRLFDYPIRMSLLTIKYLGVIRFFRISGSYLWVRLFPIKNERNLEQFFINRFGKYLYLIFFKDYTEKVWGVPCSDIKSEWGAQRIKGLSFKEAISHAIKSKMKKQTDIAQKDVETSLIDRFLYPKFGPGQLWDSVATRFQSSGGQIIKNSEVIGIDWNDKESVSVTVKNHLTGDINEYHGNVLISSMPLRELIGRMKHEVPSEVKEVAKGLVYRDFITVGLLLKDIQIKDKGQFKNGRNLPPDNWIYIQEKGVALGRLQIFNNWSPYLVANQEHVWVGLEYFCNDGDSLWRMSDTDFIEFAIAELVSLGMITKEYVLDSTIVRVPKAYPAYFGTYEHIDILKNYLNSMENIHPIGRNGMHKYNNQDHSMLTAMTTVDNIINGEGTKTDVWSVNTEQKYHEKKNEN